MVFSSDDAARNARRRQERRAGLNHEKGDQEIHDIIILWLNFMAFFRLSVRRPISPLGADPELSFL